MTTLTAVPTLMPLAVAIISGLLAQFPLVLLAMPVLTLPRWDQLHRAQAAAR